MTDYFYFSLQINVKQVQRKILYDGVKRTMEIKGAFKCLALHLTVISPSGWGHYQALHPRPCSANQPRCLYPDQMWWMGTRLQRWGLLWLRSSRDPKIQEAIADIVLWTESSWQVVMVELTVPWEERVEETNHMKRTKYEEVSQECVSKDGSAGSFQWKWEAGVSQHRACGAQLANFRHSGSHQKACHTEHRTGKWKSFLLDVDVERWEIVATCIEQES